MAQIKSCNPDCSIVHGKDSVLGYCCDQLHTVMLRHELFQLQHTLRLQEVDLSVRSHAGAENTLNSHVPDAINPCTKQV